ncbi:hypothetical protein KAS79_01190 [Candidatus Parcubacteria bacterium]|nr:hypothetical protein [Candidatus Parcubacteria bacterium]
MAKIKKLGPVISEKGPVVNLTLMAIEHREKLDEIIDAINRLSAENKEIKKFQSSLDERTKGSLRLGAKSV